MYKGANNPYFNYRGTRAIARIRDKIRLRGSAYIHNYSLRGKGIATFYSGFYSVMGISTSLNYLPSSLNGDAKFRVSGTPDIFCIGVVRVNKLPKIEYQRRSSSYHRDYAIIDIDPKDITILISTELLRKAKFCAEIYSRTVRDEILYQIHNAQRLDRVTVKDVPHEYLSRFYSIPRGFTTNSMVEMMEIDNHIKTEVFSNLNPYVA